jgi:hypothetical protein
MLTAQEIRLMKSTGQKIAVTTAYDVAFASMAEIVNDPPPPPPPLVITPPFNAKDFVIQKGYWFNGEKNYFHL